MRRRNQYSCACIRYHFFLLLKERSVAQNAAMTSRRRRPKPDWASIKAFVEGQLREERRRLDGKLATERTARVKQFSLLDQRIADVAQPSSKPEHDSSD